MRPDKYNSNTIELTLYPSCYCVLDLLCVTWVMDGLRLAQTQTSLIFLQDPKNKSVIYCDQKLKALTKKKKVGQPGMISAIAKNLKDIKTEKKRNIEKSPET